MKTESHPLHDGLAAALWPGEWALVAGVEDRSALGLRRRLRDRARDVLADATRLTGNGRPASAVTKPVNVIIATRDETSSLMVLIQESDEEAAITTRDYGKVQEVIDLAAGREPLMEADGTAFMRPIFGLIKVDDVVEGACGLFPTQPWDSWETYLRGFFLFVSQTSRHKKHASNLLQWANWFSDRTQMPLVWEVINSRMFDERQRLFLRHGSSLGGLFIHRPVT